MPPTITQNQRYLHLSAGGPTLARVENGSTIELQYADALQNLMFSLDAAGDVVASFLYGAFGEVVYSEGEENHRRQFNGKENDAVSGLRYYGYRYYDPLTLRWSSGDPLYRFVPDLGFNEPQRMNLYAFSLNNPVRYYDPDGRDAKDNEPEAESESGCVVVDGGEPMPHCVPVDDGEELDEENSEDLSDKLAESAKAAKAKEEELANLRELIRLLRSEMHLSSQEAVRLARAYLKSKQKLRELQKQLQKADKKVNKALRKGIKRFLKGCLKGGGASCGRAIGHSIIEYSQAKTEQLTVRAQISETNQEIRTVSQDTRETIQHVAETTSRLIDTAQRAADLSR